MLTSMKKLIILVFVFISFQLNAQNYIGGRVGVNLANVSINSDGFNFSPDRIFGINAAFFAEFGIGNNIAIQPELSFLQKGWRLKFEFFGSLADNSVKLNYIDVPILFKYKFGPPNAVNGYAILGPSFGYAFSGTVKDHVADTSESIEFSDDDGFKRTELGAVIGVGMGFPAGTGNFIFDLRYNLGITNLSDDPSVEDDTAYNRGINISVGYRAPLGGVSEE